MVVCPGDADEGYAAGERAALDVPRSPRFDVVEQSAATGVEPPGQRQTDAVEAEEAVERGLSSPVAAIDVPKLLGMKKAP